MYVRPETSLIFDFIGVALIIFVSIKLMLFLLTLLGKDFELPLGGYRAPPPPPPEPLRRNLNLCEGLSLATVRLLSTLHEFDAKPRVTLTFATYSECRLFLRDLIRITGPDTRLDLSSTTFDVNGIEFKLEVKQENDNEDR